MAEMHRKSVFMRKRTVVFIVLIVILVIVALWDYLFKGTKREEGKNLPTFTVKRGPLRIDVTQTGTIQAREKIIVKSEVEGKTSIIFLVDEGANVKKGDLLVELDSSNLLDQKIDQEIRVQNAEAAFIGARENLAVVENQAQSDMDKAQLNHDFAVQDLEKYTKGEYPNQLKEAESRITLAEEELARAREKLEWSRKLFAEKYISQTELQADELAEKKKDLDLDLARNDLDLLINFTNKRQLAQLESDVKQADMALDRTTRKAKADVVQAEANLKAKESEYRRQKDKLEKIESQIKKTKIYAPADGLVIYATSAEQGHRFGRSVEPLDEGSIVQERQELIHLPTTSGYNAEIGVYEASLDKVKVGLPVIVTVDAIPGKRFTGHVASIAPLPDAQSAFLNPDLKIYNTIITMDNNGNTDLLRTGMNCTAEIIVEQYEEALYVPVQAVLRVAGKPTVYVIGDRGVEPREVKIGLDNNRMVRIIDGIKEGEQVSLAPPLVQAAVGESGYEKGFEPEGKFGPEPSADKIKTRDPDTPSVQQEGSEPDTRKTGPTAGNRFMSFLDKDGDGKISMDEFPGQDDVFKRLDKNGDGYINKSEAPERPRGSGPPAGLGPSRGAP